MSDFNSLHELESRLLSAARHERAPASTRKRVRAAVGLGAGAGVVAASGSAAAFTATGLLKFAAFGVAGGLIIVSAAKYTSAPNPAPLAVSTSAPAAESPTQPAAIASAVQPEPLDSAPSPMRVIVSSAPATPSQSNAPSLRDELAVLDAARAALRAHDAASCLRVLDRYEREFPGGQMAAEAMVMRMDALVKSGQRSAATRLATAFAKANPRSPLLPRVLALVPESNP